MKTKRNFGIPRQLYFQMPRELRRKIRSEFDAGFALYGWIRISTPKQMRTKARSLGYKNVKQAMLNILGPAQKS